MYVVDERQATIGTGKPVVCVAKKLSLQPDSAKFCVAKQARSECATHWRGMKTPGKDPFKAGASLRPGNQERANRRDQSRRESYLHRAE